MIADERDMHDGDTHGPPASHYPASDLPHDAREYLPINDDGVVTQSAPCLECGYVLRGMSVRQSCPECDTPVARSLRALLLRFADAGWLRMMRLGVTITTTFIVINLLVPLDLTSPRFADDALLAPAGWFIMLIVTCMFIIGQWLISTPEPTGLLSHNEDRVRIAIRILSILAAGLLLTHDAAVTRIDRLIEVPIIALTTLAMLGAVVTTALHMRRMADRVPDAELRAATTATAIGFAALLIMYLLTVLWMARLGVSAGRLRPVNIITLLAERRIDTFAIAIMWLLAISAVVSTIGAVVVCISFRRAIREVLHEQDAPFTT